MQGISSMNIFEGRNGGAEITKRKREEVTKGTGGSSAGFLYERDSGDDELSKLMPSLKKQLEAFDNDEGNLNFMGEIISAKMENFCHADKENMFFDRNSIRPARRRRESGPFTVSRPIDFNKLLASKKTSISAPSSRLYENITSVLKENVNRAGNQFQIVDDFWSTEEKKKISAIARRRLSGMKTPAQTKPKAVEDRNVRHARSRRGGANSRTHGRRPIKLDLHLDAAKISEWDQETLAEEEIPPPNRACSGAFMTAARPTANAEGEVQPSTRAQTGAFISADADEEVQPSTRAQTGAFMSADADEEVPPSSRAYSVSAGRTAADSPDYLPDMELSSSQSPLVKVPEFSGRVEPAQTPVQDPGSARAGFPVPESSPQMQRLPLTSPTPPPNPVAAYMSSRHLEREVRQRRLSFLSSPSSDSIDTGRSRERATRFLSQEENAMRTIPNDPCQDYVDLEVPDFNEVERCDMHNGSSLGEQTQQNGLHENQEVNETVNSGAAHEGESKLKVDQTDHLPPDVTKSFCCDFPIENEAQVLQDELLEAEANQAAPQCVDEHKSNPPTEDLIGTDEGSTTQTEPKTVKRRIKKAELRRFSLEDCGSIWTEKGIRKSQRITVRPLEWWRGEKLLYSRIHNSLTTVVGAKFSSGSCTRGIDDAFVVESYVSAQYSERVRFAAI